MQRCATASRKRDRARPTFALSAFRGSRYGGQVALRCARVWTFAALANQSSRERSQAVAKVRARPTYALCASVSKNLFGAIPPVARMRLQAGQRGWRARQDSNLRLKGRFGPIVDD